MMVPGEIMTELIREWVARGKKKKIEKDMKIELPAGFSVLFKINKRMPIFELVQQEWFIPLNVETHTTFDPNQK